jgi:3-methyladenine DNA glycosylase AlkD
LLNDKENLIHKAVGWMLREVGKRNLSILKEFLENYSHKMPRTMLGYAIEKLTAEERQYYLKSSITR